MGFRVNTHHHFPSYGLGMTSLAFVDFCEVAVRWIEAKAKATVRMLNANPDIVESVAGVTNYCGLYHLEQNGTGPARTKGMVQVYSIVTKLWQLVALSAPPECVLFV